MHSRNVATFRAAHRAFNLRDFDSLASLMREDFTYRDHARGMTYDGVDAFKSFINVWIDAFSNAALTDAIYIDAGDVVVAQFRGRGINDGGMGPFRATGRAMDLPFCEIMWFDDRGRMTAGAIYYDVMTVLTQLGIAPSPTAAH